MPAVGAKFRAAREARALSLSEVAEDIHIRAVYLAEIEAENWRAIGAPVYVRGFLRTYARFLGLDPEEAVAEFNATLPAGAAATSTADHSSPAAPRAPRGLSPLIWIAGTVALFLVAFVIYNAVTLRRPAPTQGIAVATSPTGLQSTAPARSPAPAPVVQPNTLTLRVSAPSWIRVTIDGNVSMEGTFAAGTAKSFHGHAALVRIGNAGGVDLAVDGKRVGKLGGVGDVVERSFIL
ncbi:MAG: helix-turn-helix domain-containing protein [Candidatus Eremiobacteraeota bacterium]|nr:helix-turn-helix domain-containing protein [Candidatus Eremiobacteraeota bacterium]